MKNKEKPSFQRFLVGGGGHEDVELNLTVPGPVADLTVMEAGGVLPVVRSSKPRSQYNNRKMTFDRMLRDWWIEIAEAHGYEIEKEPVKGAEALPVMAYKM